MKVEGRSPGKKKREGVSKGAGEKKSISYKDTQQLSEGGKKEEIRACISSKVRECEWGMGKSYIRKITKKLKRVRRSFP